MQSWGASEGGWGRMSVLGHMCPSSATTRQGMRQFCVTAAPTCEVGEKAALCRPQCVVMSRQPGYDVTMAEL